jgi:hypothetical protein
MNQLEFNRALLKHMLAVTSAFFSFLMTLAWWPGPAAFRISDESAGDLEMLLLFLSQDHQILAPHYLGGASYCMPVLAFFCRRVQLHA